jgi:hypothetical protein
MSPPTLAPPFIFHVSVDTLPLADTVLNHQKSYRFQDYNVDEETLAVPPSRDRDPEQGFQVRCHQKVHHIERISRSAWLTAPYILQVNPTATVVVLFRNSCGVFLRFQAKPRSMHSCVPFPFSLAPVVCENPACMCYKQAAVGPSYVSG